LGLLSARAQGGRYEIVLNVPTSHTFQSLSIEVEMGSVAGSSLNAGSFTVLLGSLGQGTG
jgi:hypothetical protein